MFGVELADLLLPVHLIITQLQQTRFIFLLRIAAMTDLGFKPRHLGTGLVVFGLCSLHAIIGYKMGFAGFFKTRFRFTQGGVLRLEIVHPPFDVTRHAFAFRLCVVAPKQPQQLLLARQFIAEITILAGHSRLPFQTFHLRAEFQTDILDASQVLARIGDPALGFLASLLVLGDTGRFFEEYPQLIGSGLDNA